MILRPYQQTAVNAIRAEWQEHNSTLAVMATGTGKTIVFANVLAERKEEGRGLVLAHRLELIDQAADKIHKATDLNTAVEMAERYAYEGDLYGKAHVLVSSIQTQIAGWNGKGRMHRFDPYEFSTAVVDEAHHAPANSYRAVLQHYQQNPKLKLLGVTATPDRHDEEALGQVFGSVAFVYEINDAISDGWLVPIYQNSIVIEDLDLSACRTTAGDLNGADLARIMEYEEALHEIATPTIEIADGRKTLVFAASVAHAERLCEIFNRHDAQCARWVCGKTPKDERAAMFRDYAAGKFQLLCNVGVATEGFDEPGIEVVAVARPTKSRALYSQMVGRGTRALPGVVDDAEPGALGADVARKKAIGSSRKPFLEVLDFVGNAGRHKLMSCADILGGNYSDAVIKRAQERAESAGEPVDMTDELAKAEKEIRDEYEREKRRHIRAKARYQKRAIDPFDILDIRARRERGWNKGKLPTARMAEVLANAGIEVDGLSFSRASDLIGGIIQRREEGKCTFKQAKILKRFGYSTDQTFDIASKIIDRLAANGWKRPASKKKNQPATV